MTIINSIRNLNPFKREFQYLDDEGKPKTTIQTGKKKEFGGIGKTARTASQLNKYWDTYSYENTVWAAINSIAFNTVMVGYNIESESENAKKLIEEWCRRVNLETHLLDSTRYALALGDSFIEIVHNKKKEPSSIINVNPMTMEILYDEHGTVEGYQQSLGAMDKSGIPKLDKETICHIKFFSSPKDPYGISLIKASENVIDKKIRTDDAIANAIIRHGTSKTVFTVGSASDKHLPPKEVLEAIRDEVEDIDEKNEFIVPWNVTVSTIDEKGIAGVEEYYNYFQSQMVTGLLCPEEALGMGRGSTEATANVKSILYERMIQAFQLRLARSIEKGLFNKVLESNGFDPDIVTIEFRSVTEADESDKAKWIGNLIRGFRSSKVKPFTINEIRRKFNLKPLDIPEADTIIYEDSLGETPEDDEDEKEEEDEEDEDDEDIDDKEEKPKKEKEPKEDKDKKNE